MRKQRQPSHGGEVYRGRIMLDEFVYTPSMMNPVRHFPDEERDPLESLRRGQDGHVEVIHHDCEGYVLWSPIDHRLWAHVFEEGTRGGTNDHRIDRGLGFSDLMLLWAQTPSSVACLLELMPAEEPGAQAEDATIMDAAKTVLDNLREWSSQASTARVYGPVPVIEDGYDFRELQRPPYEGAKREVKRKWKYSYEPRLRQILARWRQEQDKRDKGEPE